MFDVKIKKIHRWNLSPAEAVALQASLRNKVKLAPLPLGGIEYISGSDIAVSKQLGKLIAAVVVMSFPRLELVETRTASTPLVFPYVPGLLSFREIPALVKAMEKVESRFDVMLCNGQGIAHPRRLGLATHLGIMIGKPTVGCAKSRLVGEYDEVSEKRGSFSLLRYGGTVVGSVLRTRAGVKPLFVSPGHLVDNASARRLVLAASGGYRLPEPTRQAHIMAGKHKKRLEERGKAR